MKTTSTRSLCYVVAGLLLAPALLAQNAQGPRINFPAASPASTLKQKVGFTDIEIVYSRPSVKGRKIFGGLVPNGDVWRTGANSPTKVTFSTPVTFGGKQVEAGTYGLYSIPGEDEWTVILNKVGERDWGAYNYKAENDVARVTAKPETLSKPVETFTIGIGDIRSEGATLTLEWDKTRVPVKFEVDVVKPIVAQIDSALSSGAQLPAGFYFQAAMFYHDNGLDIGKAKTWIEQATKDNAPFYMLHGKAKILAKAGDKEGAIAAAQQSIAAAEGAAKAEYVRLNEALIKSLK